LWPAYYSIDMRILVISSRSEVDGGDLEYISKHLERINIEYRNLLIEDGDSLINGLIKDFNPDIIIAIGGDKIILKTLLNIDDRNIPLLPLSGKSGPGFFTDYSFRDLPSLLNNIVKRLYRVVELDRIRIHDGGEILPPALNEVYITSSTPGRIIRYSIHINNEFIWRDTADGVIVSTETGSTAYSMSAGGPILRYSESIVIVPVNTLIPSHRPIVTSINSEVTISDLYGSDYIIIVDGQYRWRVKSSSLRVSRAEAKACIIKMDAGVEANLDARLSRRLISGGRIDAFTNLPPSAKLVYKILEYEGPLTLRELRYKSMLPPRTLRYALGKLLSIGLVKRGSLDKDARISVYSIIDTHPTKVG